jgi:hypothetical protein
VTDHVPPDLQRGLIYTVHPRILAPLVSGEEYRILVSTRILMAQDAPLASYEPLYRRARLLARRRAEELTCEDASARPHIWIAAHGWFRMDITDAALAGAVVVLGAVCGTPAPPGRDEPTMEALCSPHTPEMAADRSIREGTWDEFYNDFDMRRSVDQPSVLTVSYGEYVFARDGIDVDALTARALQRARSYFDLTEPSAEMTLVRQEWDCLETGKTLRPLLAHVTMQFAP